MRDVRDVQVESNAQRTPGHTKVYRYELARADRRLVDAFSQVALCSNYLFHSDTFSEVPPIDSFSNE